MPNAAPAPVGRPAGIVIEPLTADLSRIADLQRQPVGGALVRDAVRPALQARGIEARLTVTGSLTASTGPRACRRGPGCTTGLVQDIDRAIAASAVCVVPLTEGGGTRLKVLHAMAVGTPVVSTRKGVEGLGLEPGRDVLVADGADAFADAVQRVLTDGARRSRLAARGMRVVEERFTWAHSGRALDRALTSARERWERRTTERAPPPSRLGHR